MRALAIEHLHSLRYNHLLSSSVPTSTKSNEHGATQHGGIKEQSDSDYHDDDWIEGQEFLGLTFEVTLLTTEFLSIRFEYYHSVLGAAHPNRWAMPKNFLLAPKAMGLTLDSIFDLSPTNRIFLSEKIKRHLLRQKRSNNGSSSEYYRKELDNYFDESSIEKLKFYLTPQALVFRFDPYDVGCYAEGEYEVKIKYTTLSRMLNNQHGIGSKILNMVSSATSRN